MHFIFILFSSSPQVGYLPSPSTLSSRERGETEQTRSNSTFMSSSYRTKATKHPKLNAKQSISLDPNQLQLFTVWNSWYSWNVFFEQLLMSTCVPWRRSGVREVPLSRDTLALLSDFQALSLCILKDQIKAFIESFRFYACQIWQCWSCYFIDCKIALSVHWLCSLLPYACSSVPTS